MSVRSAQETVYAYHQRTKHAFERYAAGPGHLDWATQPSPFREFKGAERVPLPLVSERNLIPYRALFEPGYIAAAKEDLAALGLLFELSFGLSAWKVYGEDRWALRCNPSSGNLHPTEAYLITPGQPFLPGGVYHYHSHAHALERRCRADLAFSGCLVALSSVFWREAWKYGERAFRYCQHDVGHALGALNYAAAVLGWSVHLLEAWGDEDIAALLGLDREADFAGAEREAPDLLCWVGPAVFAPATIDIDRLLASVQSGTWSGQANRLSATHRHDWPVIEEVHAASLKPRTHAVPGRPGDGRMAGNSLPFGTRGRRGHSHAAQRAGLRWRHAGRCRHPVPDTRCHMLPRTVSALVRLAVGSTRSSGALRSPRARS